MRQIAATNWVRDHSGEVEYAPVPTSSFSELVGDDWFATAGGVTMHCPEVDNVAPLSVLTDVVASKAKRNASQGRYTTDRAC